MIGKITVESEQAKEVEVTTVKADFFKSKTKIVLDFDKGVLAGLDVFEAVKKDVMKIHKEDGKVKVIFCDVSEAKSAGRMFSRAVNALEKVGITITDLPDPKDDFCSVELRGMTTSDIAPVMSILTSMADRASRAMGHTKHPLTIFDLKQAIGVIQGAKLKDKSAMALLKWFAVKEEENKPEKPEKVAKPKGKAIKNAGKASPKAASLSNLAA